MDLIKRSRINDENERKELLDENEDLKNLNQKLKDEKNKLILDLQNKDLIINNYENDLENIDENIEEIKNKMKKIENLTFLTKGFQLYLSQRIDKKINKAENIFLYLSSSSMEIENLVYNLKIQEEFIIRLDKEILNMETEIENYKKNESQIKANHSNNYKTNLEL